MGDFTLDCRLRCRRVRRRFREPRYYGGMINAEQVHRWVTQTIRMMVEHPDSVRVEQYESGNRIALRVWLDPRDARHVIGKQGRHARALRTLGGVIAARTNAYFTLDIPPEQ